MQYEVSSGAVVFTRKDNDIYFVIVKSLEGFYGFPKGHIEGNETEKETVLREIYEEIGIKPQIFVGFRTIDEHPIPNKKDVIKRIIYFVAEYDNQQLCYQEEELEGAYLMTYEEAMSAFQFESSKRILNEAKKFIV
ncbi:NUDIX domain-containing protein [Clostridium oryzae]|uniref:Diadenosine hexaphosphate hydrolase n=1 Tax=Clostridium oryzae TaxID=1450648 RepID=A0A1V4IC71_9CLOT|nr:NUDIX domain-containing protein [Clostridium oryzae]OPJ57454.1 diadenosine hexaphosphate hydrolase [Clostridium oryzae]